MTTPKTAQLTVSEWQAVCLRDIEELYNALRGISYPNDDAIAKIDQHMARWSTFMRSWKLAGEQQGGETEQPVEAVEPVKPAKRKGGWPKGKPRRQKAEPRATVQ